MGKLFSLKLATQIPGYSTLSKNMEVIFPTLVFQNRKYRKC